MLAEHHGRSRRARRAGSAAGIAAGALGPAVAAAAPPGVETRRAEEGNLAAVAQGARRALGLGRKPTSVIQRANGLP
jgi:hypothetical protein